MQRNMYNTPPLTKDLNHGFLIFIVHKDSFDSKAKDANIIQNNSE